MTGKAPKLSEFGEVAEAAFRERDVFVGQPAKRRELIASIEAQGMTADEFRLVMRWWGRQTGFSTPKALLDVLGSEVNWRDVAASERPLGAIDAAAGPGEEAERRVDDRDIADDFRELRCALRCRSDRGRA